jgi:hypothetical protein
MGLDNKNLLYYTVINFHKQQQQNNSNNLHLLFILVMKVDYTSIVHICKQCYIQEHISITRLETCQRQLCNLANSTRVISITSGVKNWPVNRTQLYTELVFDRGPCLVIYCYNKSQQYALFLNFIW